MKASTVRGHARMLRRCCEGATLADAVPDHVPDFNWVIVADLPALTLNRIAADHAAWRLVRSGREWIAEQRASTAGGRCSAAPCILVPPCLPSPARRPPRDR